MNKCSAPTITIVLLAMLVSCAEDRSPTAPSQPKARWTSPAASPQLALLDGAQTQVFDCSNLADANVRFSSPGHIHGNEVRLFVMYEGLPTGDKKLQVWWDEEDDPTHSQRISLGEGDPMNENHTRFMIRDTFDHVYRGVTEDEKRRVRVRLSVEGSFDDCSRVRHIKIGPPLDTPAGCSGIMLTGPVWYVDAGAPAGGTGAASSPFNTMAAAEAASSAGDTVYVHSGAYALSARFDLLNGQSLIGSGVDACHNSRSLPATSAPILSRPSGRIIQTNGSATIIGISTSGGRHAIRAGAPGSVVLRDLRLSGFSRNGIRVGAAATVTGTRLVIDSPGGSWGTRQNDGGSTLSLSNSTVNATQGHRIIGGATLQLNGVDLTMQNDRGLRAVGGAANVAGSGNTATSVSPLCSTNATGSFSGSVQFVSVNGGGAGSCP